jgi:hypothetical protein
MCGRGVAPTFEGLVVFPSAARSATPGELRNVVRVASDSSDIPRVLPILLGRLVVGGTDVGNVG